MKRFLILLLLAVIAAPAFADDALTIPQNVIRFRAVPSVTIQNQAFNDDAERKDIGSYDSAQIYNLNFALEYGVTDWATAAVQWTPGWRVASVFDNPVNAPAGALQTKGVPAAAIPDNTDIESKGLSDLFIGGKFQIVGENAPVMNQTHRLAASVGMIAPLSTYDAKQESKDYINGDPYQVARVDEDALGIGTRLHYDFVVKEGLYINLYNEFLYYLPRDLKEFNVNFDTGAGELVTDVTESEYAYGYDLTFELEPQYALPLSEGLELGFALPATYNMWPETEVDGTGQDNDGYSFTVAPSVNLFAQNLPWPIDFDLSYSIPVAGKNTSANHTIALQIKNYLQF